MTDKEGSKDGLTWEEMTREEQNTGHRKSRDQQALSNLMLLKKWCENKMIELEKNGK